MPDIKLIPEQIQTLRRYGEDFKKWSSTEEGQKNMQVFREDKKYYKENVLSRKHLNKMTRDEFAQIWQDFTNGFWGNVEWYIKKKIIDPNSGKPSQETFCYLLEYGMLVLEA